MSFLENFWWQVSRSASDLAVFWPISLPLAVAAALALWWQVANRAISTGAVLVLLVSFLGPVVIVATQVLFRTDSLGPVPRAWESSIRDALVATSAVLLVLGVVLARGQLIATTLVSLSGAWAIFWTATFLPHGYWIGVDASSFSFQNKPVTGKAELVERLRSAPSPDYIHLTTDDPSLSTHRRSEVLELIEEAGVTAPVDWVNLESFPVAIYQVK